MNKDLQGWVGLDVAKIGFQPCREPRFEFGERIINYSIGLSLSLLPSLSSKHGVTYL